MMKAKSTTVRVDYETKLALDEIASAQGKPIASVIAELVEPYRKKSLLDSINKSFIALKHDKKASHEAEQEAKVLEGTLMDCLEEC